MGLVYSLDYCAFSAIREWFRNHYQARSGCRKAQREYLTDVHNGCRAVVFPDQRGEDDQPHVAHVWRSLQRAVNHVGLPLRLPGSCDGTTRVVLRQPRAMREPPAMEAPPTTEEYASAFGPIKAVRVPHTIHDTMGKARLHHLGDYISEDGTLKLTRRAMQAYVPDKTAGYFIKWFRKYWDNLKDCLDDDVPR